MLSKKRRRLDPPTIHPRNKYSEKPPDFQLLASLYPSFQPFVFFSRSGRPTVDWTDFNTTRELTRVLLHHDYGVQWWIPDGQLCPTVPNRSNYIHWIGDLLSSEVIPKGSGGSDEKVRGFDIGTGANCIYPLLGASLFGWSFVGSDVTDIALEWAKTNVESNPHLQELIEIRKANDQSYSSDLTPNSKEIVKEEEGVDVAVVVKEAESLHSSSKQSCYSGPPVLVGVIRCDEKFDFCMCNPPFFESIDGAGLNPRTSCGGTLEEMVCPGGEQAFITRIIEDSVGLKTSFRWFTSMVGKKVNLKLLVSKLRQVGVSIVKTTEFVQGQTARWGLAWSFMSPHKRLIVHHGPEKSHHSFMLEGLQRQLGALQVLKAVECFFLAYGASCKSDFSSFFVNVTLSEECTGVILKENQYKCSGNASKLTSNGSDNLWCPSDEPCFRIAVFEQIPGTLLVKGSLLHKENPLSGMFSSVLQCLEEALRKDFVDKFRGQFKA